MGTRKEILDGAVALCSSQDLIHETYERVLYDHDLDQICKCPDLLSLEDTDIWVCCPQTCKPTPGSKGNLQSVARCATRLRIITEDKLKGSFFNSGQYQIFFGAGLVNKI